MAEFAPGRSFGSRRITMKLSRLTLTLVSLGLGISLLGEAARSARAEDNPIIPDGAKLELLFTREAPIKGGLTEGPTVAPDGSIYFSDIPFGEDNGMIMRFDPQTKK